MKTPFEFGTIVTGESFTNREEERKRLKSNFTNGINTILISPRRWGKSSLVKEVARTFSKKSNTRFCFIDLFQVRNEEEFYQLFAKSIFEATSDKIDELLSLAKEFLSNVTPRISLSPDPMSSFDIGFDFEKIKTGNTDILNLPEKIARKKGINLVVCIDEFQNLANISDSLAIQKKLRSVWQQHKDTTYCIYGSKRNMLLELFHSRSMPFYKFGDVIFLEKIKQKHLVNFIVKSFEKTKKNVPKEIAQTLTEYMQCHPYYVQQLAHLLWLNTSDSASMETLETALSDLLRQNAIFYQREFEGLSDTQVQFLKALCNGETRFFSKKVLKNYDLGSSSNVAIIKNALEKKEITDNFEREDISFVDPGFELWFKRIILQ